LEALSLFKKLERYQYEYDLLDLNLKIVQELELEYKNLKKTATDFLNN